MHFTCVRARHPQQTIFFFGLDVPYFLSMLRIVGQFQLHAVSLDISKFGVNDDAMYSSHSSRINRFWIWQFSLKSIGCIAPTKKNRIQPVFAVVVVGWLVVAAVAVVVVDAF